MPATPHLLQQKLPAISAWITSTLAAHAAQARSVAACGFARLPAYYPVELLQATKVIALPRVPMPPARAMGMPEFAAFEQMNAAGITFLDTFFVQTKFASDESLHFHELVHVVQWSHLGLERFVLAYGLGHLLYGGYRPNPLEVMAFDLQARFEQEAQPFEAASATRRALDRVVPDILRRAGLEG